MGISHGTGGASLVTRPAVTETSASRKLKMHFSILQSLDFMFFNTGFCCRTGRPLFGSIELLMTCCLLRVAQIDLHVCMANR